MLAVYLRYETLIATQKAAGMQGSVPMGAFHVLRDHLGVNGECFASPLNQTLLYLDTKDGGGGSGGGSGQTFSFCSAFKDTDHWFGSKGSFFSSSFIDHLKTHGGHYEANPPFGKNEMCFSKMLQLMVNALIVTSKAGMTSDGKVVPPRPLSFCIISPTNNFDLSSLIRAMRENKKKMECLTKTSQNGRLTGEMVAAPWLRQNVARPIEGEQVPNFLSHEISFKEGQHFYVQGNRNTNYSSKGDLWRATSDSCFMWLQNAPAVEKWKVDNLSLRALHHAFKNDTDTHQTQSWMMKPKNNKG
jgi:hypothetical protein